ncbi:MAG: fused response regulator/phosphatase [SAR324 cluster bacterium]|nr:fused response regulator/phosphatase [SAR324 cluster bacterium]
MDKETQPVRELPQILLTDDDLDNLIVLEKILKDPKWVLIKASSGREAVGLAKSNEFAFIILDVHMPGIDGFKTAELIRHFGQSRHSPIVFLTAAAIKEENVFQGYEVGAVDYMFKPPDPHVLKSKAIIFTELFLQKQLIQKQQKDLEHAYADLKFSKEKLGKLYGQLQDQLDQAQIIQEFLLPQALPEIPGIEFAAKYISMDQVGGDFYDCFQLENGNIGIFIADVTGHGASASLISTMISGLFKRVAKELESPAAVLMALNNMLMECTPDDKFATAFYCVYNPESQILYYSTAGHPHGCILKAGAQKVIPLQMSSLMMGLWFGEQAQYTDITYPMQSGDALLLYTDGITEITNEANQEFGLVGLTELLQKSGDLPITQIIENIYQCTLQFSEKHLFDDDITMIGFKILPSSNNTRRSICQSI